MNEELLLSQVSEISKKHELLYEKTGGYFNIFKIANISTDEVRICRLLYELLSPTGSHYQGTAYLKLFFYEVLKQPISKDDLKSAQVFREYRIDQNRRIDLVIKTNTYFIPIEVKINAEDQKNQCYDYFIEAQKRSQNLKVFYLTRFGNPPSEDSANGLTKCYDGENYEEIVPLSFSEDILLWLDKCLKNSNTVKIAPIREVILQFMPTIRDFTNKIEDDEEMEIKNLLATPENMKSALTIQSVLQDVREDCMRNLFKSIEEKVGIEKLHNKFDYTDSDYEKIKTFYTKKASSYPGISYLYEHSSGQEIWTRIEIDQHIFIGYFVPIGGKPVAEIPSLNKKMKSLRESYLWCIGWKYLPDDNQGQNPNFMYPNDSYYELFDEKKMDEFSSYCAEKIKEFLALEENDAE